MASTSELLFSYKNADNVASGSSTWFWAEIVDYGIDPSRVYDAGDVPPFRWNKERRGSGRVSVAPIQP
jgi:hypothetical protein